MKKTVGLFILASIAVVLVSCKEKCIQDLSPIDAPALSNSDYNSCWTVLCNFYYASVDNKDYPYYNREGENIKCCGFVKSIGYAEDGAWVQLLMEDRDAEGNSTSFILAVESDSTHLNGVDLNEKCYVIGRLSFGRDDSHFGGWLNAQTPGSCISANYIIIADEIRN